jgi:biopolymer transport protein ExbB
MNILSLLLQVNTITETAADGLSGSDLLLKGGYLMIPIILLSIYALYLFIERIIFIKQMGKTNDPVLEQIRDRIAQGKIDEAESLCKSSTNVIAKIYGKGLSRLGSPVRDIENVLENTANSEIGKMEKNIGTLSAIAAVAPMIGFLGTVVGMIRSFYNISVTNDISIGIIAGGIYEKMITSASGLLVGILAYIFVTLLNNMIGSTINKMEDSMMSFLDLLYTPHKK